MHRNRTHVTANGYLNHAISKPPDGIFRCLRTRDTDTVTWQPQPNVRIAAVMHQVSGPTPGFLVAGRSLRVVEEQESLFWRIVFSGWFALILLLAIAAAVLKRTQHRNTTPA
jgi:hypothetical protein